MELLVIIWLEKFAIKTKFELVDFCLGRFAGTGNYIVIGYLTKLEGG